MNDASAKSTASVPALQAQGRDLRRALARIDRKIAHEQDRLRQIESRLAILAQQQALAA
jgi:hypothetical protein